MHIEYFELALIGYSVLVLEIKRELYEVRNVETFLWLLRVYYFDLVIDDLFAYGPEFKCKCVKELFYFFNVMAAVTCAVCYVALQDLVLTNQLINDEFVVLFVVWAQELISGVITEFLNLCLIQENLHVKLRASFVQYVARLTRPNLHEMNILFKLPINPLTLRVNNTKTLPVLNLISPHNSKWKEPIGTDV